MQFPARTTPQQCNHAAEKTIVLREAHCPTRAILILPLDNLPAFFHAIIFQVSTLSKGRKPLLGNKKNMRYAKLHIRGADCQAILSGRHKVTVYAYKEQGVAMLPDVLRGLLIPRSGVNKVIV